MLRQAAEDESAGIGVNIDESGSPQKRKRKHTYHFVSFQASTSKYFARVHLNNRRNNAGCYPVGADAAYAADELNKLLDGPVNRINFNSVQDYSQARDLELEASGLSIEAVGTVEVVIARIQQRVNKAKADLDSNRGGYGLSASQFAALTKRNHSKEASEKAPPSRVGTTDTTKAKDASNSTQSQVQTNNRSDGNEITTKPKATPKTTDLISLESDYMNGCTVMVNMKPNHRRGIYNKGNLATVIGASFDSLSRQIYYTIKPMGDDNTETESQLCSEKEVALAPETPIVYCPSKVFDSESCVQGKVLLCQTKPRPKPLKYSSGDKDCEVDVTCLFYYTIIIYPDDTMDNFEVIEDVPSSRIKYRSGPFTTNAAESTHTT